MVVVGRTAQRYTAKAARRPIRFWWQPFMLLGLLVFLWCQLPLTAVLYEARSLPRATDARAAYVLLDAAYAAHAFRNSVSVWTSGIVGMKQSQDPELGGIDLSNATFAPEYLEQGRCYPGSWSPAKVRVLDMSLPDVAAFAPSSGSNVLVPPLPFQGVRIQPDASLRRSVFAVPSFDGTPPERSGHSRFYVETGADGTTEHVLLLTTRTPGAALFEHLLLKGRAKGEARGFVEVDWFFAK